MIIRKIFSELGTFKFFRLKFEPQPRTDTEIDRFRLLLDKETICHTEEKLKEELFFNQIYSELLLPIN